MKYRKFNDKGYETKEGFFYGRVASAKKPTDIRLEPPWVYRNFDEKFIKHIMSQTVESDEFIAVPVGSAIEAKNYTED